MKKNIAIKKGLIFLIFCVLGTSNIAFSESTLIEGDLYVTPDCIKVGKESTNQIYYFDELSLKEQQWLLNHPESYKVTINGKTYLNVTQMDRDLHNKGYGMFTTSYNAREYDKYMKSISTYHTYEEAGVNRINGLHTPTILGNTSIIQNLLNLIRR